jgi:hypothetical protein
MLSMKLFVRSSKATKSMRLSKSNSAINTDEPPKALWQKLKNHIKPHDYFVMLPLDVRLPSSQDKRILEWILVRP